MRLINPLLRFGSLTRILLLTIVLGTLFASLASAQIPPPTNPLVFCGTQAGVAATSYQITFDGGAPEAVTMTLPATAGAIKTFCDANHAGWTHAFTLPASRFVVRATPYAVVVRAINSFGTTAGPAFNVLIGVAPGSFTIGGVGQLP